MAIWDKGWPWFCRFHYEISGLIHSLKTVDIPGCLVRLGMGKTGFRVRAQLLASMSDDFSDRDDGTRPASTDADLLQQLIRWDEEDMRTGIPAIDEEHRELIRKINELYRIHQTGATIDDIAAVLRFLNRFVQSHFKHEEELMDKRKCSARMLNRMEHAHFLQEFQELVASFTLDLDTDQAASKIERMTARWLTGHICRVDVCLREPPKEPTD
jgi:hemerythrin-like metal-binding protein